MDMDYQFHVSSSGSSSSGVFESSGVAGGGEKEVSGVSTAIVGRGTRGTLVMVGVGDGWSTNGDARGEDNRVDARREPVRLGLLATSFSFSFSGSTIE